MDVSQNEQSGFALPPEAELQRSRLCLSVGPGMIRAVVTDTGGEVRSGPVRIPLPEGQSLRSLTEAIYSVPGLTADYGKVDLAWRTESFCVLPAALEGEALESAASIMGLTAADNGEKALFTDVLDVCRATLAWSLPQDVANFLARTFRNPTLHHPLAVLADYFCRRSARGNCAKIYVHAGAGDVLDITCVDSGGRLRTLIWRHASSDAEALYLIMALFEANGMDARTDQIVLCGSASRRPALTGLLRRYVARVLPLIMADVVENGTPLLNLLINDQ